MRTIGYNAPRRATILSGIGDLQRPLSRPLPPAFWLFQPWTPRRARPLAQALPRPLSAAFRRST